jgi:hypothetical protein
MYPKLNKIHLLVALALLVSVAGAPLHAAEDGGTATLAVTIDPTVACVVGWIESNNASHTLGNIPAGTQIEATLTLACAHNLGTGSFAVDVASAPVTGGLWDEQVTIEGNSPAFFDPNSSHSQSMGTYVSGPDQLSEVFPVFTDASATQDPGTYQFAFTLTATSL